MANIKISELEELTTVADDDVLPIVDVSENETKKINKSNIINGLVKENTDALLTNVVSRNLLGMNNYSYVIWNLNSDATLTAGKENLKITTSGKAYSGIFGKLCQFANLDTNKTYTVSFDAKASANVNLQYGITSNSRQTSITSQTKRISFQETGKALKNTNFQFYCLSTVVCTITIENIMIDEGTVATDYTPYVNLQELQDNSFINNYLTDEQSIGKWIDGKPLYRKTISLAINKSGVFLLFAHNIQNIQDIADATCIFKRNTGDFYVINRTNPTTSTAYIGLTYINKTNIALTIASVFSTQITNAFVTIEYTKTTD